ncbi:MAG: UDP-N-acetylmuramoyl-tripeptide--D-alanyl-D-alanine ligase [Clostridia bacterium]|nr:UDP-N-acetylmuramoyl-tripeptide--D-alanyl-D-alanine ligase [Clostridia bacterium]
MFDFGGKLATCIVTTCLLYTATFKSLGILQQLGYQNKAFQRWLKDKDNLYFNRLFVWSVASLFAGGLAAVGVSLLGKEVSLVAFVSTCFLFSFFFCITDKNYALKVPVNVTKRLQRLALLYIFVSAVAIFILISLLGIIDGLVKNQVYSLFALAPLAFTPILTPAFLMLGNAVLSPFEKRNNARHVRKAKRVLDKCNAIRIGVVGSYGKTSVKHILSTILSSKFSVIATPESYNTPVGVAKTVNSLNIQNAEIFIAEMGARRVGDIAELCTLVNPDYAIFTGVCRQHMQTFKTEENLLKAKCEIIQGVKNRVICGAELRNKIPDCSFLADFEKDKCNYLDKKKILSLELGATNTKFTFEMGEERLGVTTALLGSASAENIALAVMLAFELGMTKEEIMRGLEKVNPIPHRLQLIESNGAYILDDAYNCSERSAKEAIDALSRFAGRRLVVTPGIVEGGELEQSINENLGELLAKAQPDFVMLVGKKIVQWIKRGYLSAGGDERKLGVYCSLQEVKELLKWELGAGDAVLFLNDLPDVY